MTTQQYQKWTAPLRRHPKSISILTAANRATTAFVYAAYGVYLIFLLLQNRPLLPAAILVPGISFVLLSLYRDRTNAPRPYEALDIQPLIVKQTKGHSFPSRHVFSVFVIAVTIGIQNLCAGIVLGAVGVAICIIRVLGGVHFPKDVLAGMALGLLSGAVGFALVAFLS
ncbi:MAG: phosphatase PAP2 family protein [Eubacteriales bacterium]|nr:phosphatase PAP2 family protein [Eubacteriales bacterium]